MQKHRRKKLNLQVKRDLQIWILKRTVLGMLAGMFIGLLILYFFSNRELGETYYQAHLTIRRVSDLLVPVIIFSGMAGFLTSLALLIFFPQRIAGPIYRLERDLCGHLREGDLTFIFKLRKDDPFQTLPEAINCAVFSLREKVFLVADKAKKARKALEKGDIKEAQKWLEDLEIFMEKELKF